MADLFGLLLLIVYSVFLSVIVSPIHRLIKKKSFGRIKHDFFLDTESVIIFGN